MRGLLEVLLFRQFKYAWMQGARSSEKRGVHLQRTLSHEGRGVQSRRAFFNGLSCHRLYVPLGQEVIINVNG
jgi:hypothetical protein